MTCLDPQIKLACMIDSIQTAKDMLSREDLRPSEKIKLEEDIRILKEEVKELYIELFRIIRN